jgi:hypothetical protein
MNDIKLPNRVRQAVLLLWIAWGISAVALLINCFLFPGVRGAIFGIVALGLQALVILFVGKGSNAARIFLIVLLVIALPGLMLISRVVEAKSSFSAVMTFVGVSLRVIATYLLFTGESRPWFTRQRPQEEQVTREP